jgi:hypothetical protein
LLSTFSAGAAFAQEATSGPTPVANSSGASSTDWAPNTPPKIWGRSLLPSDGATTTDRTPAIRAKVMDSETEFTKRNVAISLDGAKVDRASLIYSPDTHRVRYTPGTDLSAGNHTVRVVARDPQGSTARESWSFSVALP